MTLQDRIDRAEQKADLTLEALNRAERLMDDCRLGSKQRRAFDRALAAHNRAVRVLNQLFLKQEALMGAGRKGGR